MENMSDDDRKVIADAKKALLDVAIRRSSQEDIMALFAMAAASQNIDLMTDIANHPGLKVDADAAHAMKMAVSVCQGLVELNLEIEANPSMTIDDIEHRIDQLAAMVNKDTQDELEHQAQQATQDLLSKFSLH